MLGKPVVLEDLNHRAVAWSALGREPATLLTDWAAESRRAAQRAVACPPPYERTSRWAEAGWLRTPVEAQGQRWGTLVAREYSELPETAEMVLEDAALALSLGRLAGRGADEWSNLGQRHLLESLLNGSYVSLPDLQTSFEAAGLRVVDRDLVAVARRTERGAVLEHLAQVRDRSTGLDIDVLCSPWADEPSTTALFLLQAPPLRSPERTVVYRSRTGALDMFLSRKRSDPAVQAFVERVLGPLLTHDAEHQCDLLEVARACVQHPTNRKRAAGACHLSRSVFYQRMRKIEELLDADLDEGRTLATLHVALVAYGQRSNPL